MDSVASFKHFEVVEAEAKDHIYLSSKNDQIKGSQFQKTVIKEWKILEKNLPDAIYVRAYETRTDLIRAVIIGAQGTPYHDGLFFFDICLPSNYPNAPPKIHYHSHGNRLNPNLYANGYVCLSLVNTWRGSHVEMWSNESTLLQVLVSIQGLVLNARPFFNEPAYVGYRRSTAPKWINSSVKYSEKAFILTCKNLLRMVKKPPSGFEDLVVAHFRRRARAILLAVEGYRGGAAVAGESSSLNSSAFKGDLRKIRRMFCDALKALGGVENEGATLKELLKKTKEEEEKEMNTCFGFLLSLFGKKT